MASRFIESARIQGYADVSPREARMIEQEIFDADPTAEFSEIVEGGVMLFDTRSDYDTWLNQQ